MMISPDTSTSVSTLEVHGNSDTSVKYEFNPCAGFAVMPRIIVIMISAGTADAFSAALGVMERLYLKAKLFYCVSQSNRISSVGLTVRLTQIR